MTTNPARFQPSTDSPHWEGLVVPGIERGDGRFKLYTAEPCAELAPYIQSVWVLSWNIPAGQELRSIVVPTPCVHLMALTVPFLSPKPLWHNFLPAKAKGLIQSLQGHGQSFGVEFRPGGLYPFVRRALANGEASHALFPEVPAAPLYPWDPLTLENWLGEFERALCARAPAPNHLAPITKVFTQLLTAETSPTVDELAIRNGLSKRTLQRVFSVEVGLSLTEAIRICRFHKSIKAIHRQDAASLADLALASGFFDQPHMANEFKKLVDTCPGKFKKYW